MDPANVSLKKPISLLTASFVIYAVWCEEVAMGFTYYVLLAIALELTACASIKDPIQETHLIQRKPASQTQLAGSSNQIVSVIETLNQKPSLWFSRIQTIRVSGPSLVEVELLGENGVINTFRFQTTEKKCAASDCPLEVEQIK